MNHIRTFLRNMLTSEGAQTIQLNNSDMSTNDDGYTNLSTAHSEVSGNERFYFNIFDMLKADDTVCLIDTCSLMNDCYTTQLYPKLVKYNTLHPDKPMALWVLNSVKKELQGISADRYGRQSMESRRKADIISKLLTEDKDFSNVFAFYNNSEDVKSYLLADLDILSFALHKSMLSKVRVFTQDKSLAKDLCMVNEMKSVRHKEIGVSMFTSRGKLINVTNPHDERLQKYTAATVEKGVAYDI